MIQDLTFKIKIFKFKALNFVVVFFENFNFSNRE